MLKTAINRPITTIMAFLALLLFGLFALFSLPINLYPSVDIPIVKITTKAPAELGYVEAKITREIENALSSVSGIDKIESKSFDNFSVVVVIFKLGRDLETAASDIREKLGALGLPAVPAVEKISSDAGMVLSVFAAPAATASPVAADAAAIKSASSSEEMNAFMQLANDVLKPALVRAAGVGEVKLRGYFEPGARIILDTEALAARHLDAAAVVNLLRARNLKIFLGELENGEQILTAKAEFAPESLEELAALQIAQGVFLRDVARVEFGASQRKEFAALSRPGVLLEISKVAGSDTLKAIAAAKAATRELAAAHPELVLQIAYDKSFLIEKHLRQVGFDMIFGIALTIFIVFVFLRNASATLLASIAIPVSVVASFGLIYLFGYDLNRLTLIALTLAIGIFVDDAIVIIERIVARANGASEGGSAGETPAPETAAVTAGENPLFSQNRPQNPAPAQPSALHIAYEATREIIFSVFAISVVLLCVFVPISFMNSIPGLFFNTLGMSVSFGIVISFLTCVFLIPTLAARVLNPRQSAFAARTERYFLALEAAYARLLEKIFAHKAVFAAALAGVCAASLLLVPKIGLDFLPMEDDGELLVELSATQDLPLDAMAARSLALKARIEQEPSVAYAALKVGYDDAKDRKKAQIYVRLKPLEQRLNAVRQKAFVQILRAKLPPQEDLRAKIIEVPKFEGAGVDDPVQFALLGDDMAALEAASAALQAELAKLPGVVDIADDSDAPLRALKISVDELACERAGLQPNAVAAELSAALSRRAVGHLITGGRALDIFLELSSAQDLRSLDALFIQTPRGAVRLASLLRFSEGAERSVINHHERRRSIKITASTTGKLDLYSVKNYLDAAAAPVLAARGLSGEWRGFVDLLGQTVSGFLTVVALAAVLIYLVLAALYESLVMPLIIMITMPLAFIGAAAALYLAGFSFSLFVLVALILLFGMVGKNAILLIDVAMSELRAGASAEAALLRAGRARIRAILMTTLAMIGAMTPLALSHGSGYEANAPMAVAVIGGLISSTLLTLFVIPVFFTAAAKLDAFLRRLYEREQI